MKKHQKWLIWFGTGMLLNLLSLAVFSAHISVTLASSMPAALALSILFEGLFDRRPNKFRFGYIKYNGKAEDFELDESGRPSPQSRRDIWIADIKIGFSALPLFMPFIFFFADWAKIAFPIIMMVAAIVGIVIYLGVMLRKDAAQDRALNEQRLREQQRREENGEWK